MEKKRMEEEGKMDVRLCVLKINALSESLMNIQHENDTVGMLVWMLDDEIKKLYDIT